MATLWFAIIAVMLAVYVVLDGFDFGAGILHLFVAKTDKERRSVFAAIGPVWDGNEVWLLAGGGILFFAFPRAYAAGFSGFYLPLIMVLWLLIGRGISIEFRSMEASPLWRSFWDGIFFVCSSLMAIVLGAALGNIIRGVPLNGEGFFSGPLFTNFMPGENSGVLDWYTVLVGVTTLAILALHGALYLRIKTEGDVNTRATALAKKLYAAVVVLLVPTTIASGMLQPALVEGMSTRPLSWVLACGVVASLVAIPALLKGENETRPFLATVGLIMSLLAATAASLYPTLLSSTVAKANDLNISNASAGELSLQVGFYWWAVAITIAVGYFIYLFRTFRGKVDMSAEHGH